MPFPVRQPEHTNTKLTVQEFLHPFFFLLDFNECSAKPCDQNALCVNNTGSFNCTCRDGFKGDGFICGGTAYGLP